MNIPETKPAPESPERKAIIELKKAHASLRTMFHLLALCALMLTGTIFVMFYKQVAVLRRQIDEMSASVTEYETKFLPQLQIVHSNLDVFAKTNDSLTPILRRYFPTNLPNSAAPAPSSNK